MFAKVYQESCGGIRDRLRKGTEDVKGEQREQSAAKQNNYKNKKCQLVGDDPLEESMHGPEYQPKNTQCAKTRKCYLSLYAWVHVLSGVASLSACVYFSVRK